MKQNVPHAQRNALLTQARVARGWSQQELAERVGISSALEVARWEQGTSLPHASLVRTLCELFSMTVEALGFSDTSVGPPERPTAPIIWSVPYRRNPFFTGHEGLLTRLRELFTREYADALPSAYALSGLGGVGKTQLALEYTYRYRHMYQTICWLRADTQETLLADLLGLAALLQIHRPFQEGQQQVVAVVRRWFTEQSGWLLVLDNADDLELLAELLPGGDGHLLLTTRLAATGTLATSLSVDPLTLQEGTLFLLRRAKLLAPGQPLSAIEPGMLGQAEELVGALGGLPLALDQAGAHIEESGCRLSSYLHLFTRRQMELLKQRGAAPTSHPHPVASTWSLAFERLAQNSPTAVALLRFCAFLHPDAISEALLAEGVALLEPELSSTLVDPLEWDLALAQLRRFSLIQRHAHTSVLSVHRLVQVVVRESLDEPERTCWAERTVLLVNSAFPEPEMDTWSRCQEYLPHVQVCAQLIERFHL